jgi:hypothetical protein
MSSEKFTTPSQLHVRAAKELSLIITQSKNSQQYFGNLEKVNNFYCDFRILNTKSQFFNSLISIINVIVIIVVIIVVAVIRVLTCSVFCNCCETKGKE